MTQFRNLLLSVLSTTATKREAQHYIQKYRKDELKKHVSIVRISGQQNHLALNNEWSPGLGRTLSHMKDLGAFPVVIIDGKPQIDSYLSHTAKPMREYESQFMELGEKLDFALSSYGKSALTLSCPFELSADEGLIVKRDWLDRAFTKSHIPVMLPMMYDRDTNESKLIDSFVMCKYLAKYVSLQENTYMDKLIFIDPVGGLPSLRRKHAAHVLVNMRQEFGEISSEIRSRPDSSDHLANLEAMYETLHLSGPQTTGIITDPRAASNVLDRNPIIYNLLTDRPLISPSLPADLARTQLRTSLLRTGFPVYTRHAADCDEGLDLVKEDKVGNINLTKFQRLVELSFKKTLDLDHYLARLQNKVAAIIVVGDYDGCALLTWEECNSTGRKVAYLDKFMVNPSSQGAQGVADIMLIQMIRRLFPNEMLWRSRANNPVNKWYFERSRGHLRLKDSLWTMFWINEAKVPPIAEYESICRNIEPSLK